MTWTLLEIFDLIGTIAFAISGAFVGIRKEMDVFGVNVLAVTTACGGGVVRDILVGQIPPKMFLNPRYVLVAAVVANIVFLLMYLHGRIPRRMAAVYDWTLFCFDTLGLAAFTVDGVMAAVNAGFVDNGFLLVFIGFLTGVGGGTLRDMMANRIPDIFVKHIYALASIAGGVLMVVVYECTGSQRAAMIDGFLIVLVVRCLAAYFRWNLPKVKQPLL